MDLILARSIIAFTSNVSMKVEHPGRNHALLKDASTPSAKASPCRLCLPGSRHGTGGVHHHRQIALDEVAFLGQAPHLE